MSDKEYEKDLNNLKEQILKDDNTLLTKRELVERFCEIDKEYNGHSWNLLQILANINVLIGQEFCEDCVSRKSLKHKLQEHHDFLVDAYGGFGNLSQNDKARVDAITNCITMVVNEPPVTLACKKGKWINKSHTSGCGIKFAVSECTCCGKETFFDCDQLVYNYCPNCGAEMECWDMIAIKEMDKLPENCSDCDFCHGHICKRTGVDIIANPKNQCPLVEIITCKDCKYCVMTEVGCYCGRHIHRLDTHIDKYCADAERRE